MKITQILVPLLLATAAFSTSAHAQMFGTSTPAIKDSDVAVGAGGTALAWDFSDSNNSTPILTATTVVNGVTFSGNMDNASTGVDFSYAVTRLGGYDQNGVDDAALATSGGSANYASVLQHLVYGFQSFTLTFTGLKAGNSYELQTFGGGGASAPEVLTDSTTIPGPTPASPSGTLTYGASYNPAVAAFLDESFTAPASGIETITITGDSYLVFSAVNLQVVPEPSTYALMFGALGCLVFLVRRKASGSV